MSVQSGGAGPKAGPVPSAALEEKIEDLFYPGSKRRIPADRTPPKAVVEDAWDSHPVLLKVKGETKEFFTVGMLAQALGRRPATIREWEAKGHIPKAKFRTAAVDTAKQKRLYTRRQVEVMVKIAQEEGLMAVSRSGTLRRGEIPRKFTERLLEAWRGI